MRSWPRLRAVLLVILLLTMINLPVLQGAWDDWRVRDAGTDVRARVTAEAVVPPRDDPEFVVQFRFPRAIDPDRRSWTVRLERPAYERAVATGRLDVRVLRERPAAHTVPGEITSRLGLVLTLVADAVLLGLLLLARRFRGRLRPELRAVAVGDLVPVASGEGARALLERVEGDLYRVRGRVTDTEDDEVVLDLVERTVRVLLDGHRNPVGGEQTAEVRARLVG